MEVSIYVLIDPRTYKIRYIGRTSNDLNVRLNGHISKSKKKNNPKQCWIQSILSEGLRPIIKEYRKIEGSWEDSHKEECRLIKLADDSNIFELVNLKDKGPGYKGLKVTEKQKKQISQTLKRGYKSGSIKKTNTRKVTTYNLKGQKLKNYNSISACMRDIGVTRNTIENVLYKKAKRWKTYQIRYSHEASPGEYTGRDAKAAAAKLQKPITVIDNKTGKVEEYESYKEAAKKLGVSSPTIRRKVKNNKLLKNRYKITNAR